MTAPRDPERLISAVLSDGPTELPDRAYDAVRAEIDRTRQRVFVGPWRTPDMPALAKFALGAAAVLVVVLIGLNVLNRSGPSTVGGPPETRPTPTSTPTAVPTPVPVEPPAGSADAVPGDDSLMAAGSRAFYRDNGLVETRVALSVPDGWYGHGSWYISNNASDPLVADVASLAVWERSVASDAITQVFPDPCDYAVRPEPLGPAVTDLVDAVVAQGSRTTSAPTEMVVDGFSGMAIETTLASDISCGGGGHLELWRTGDDSARWLSPGMEQTIWILDVDGSRLVIEGTLGPDASDADRASLHQIMGSIRIETAASELPSYGLVPPGEYGVSLTDAHRVLVTVPTGWNGSGFYVSRDDGDSPKVRGISFWTVARVTSDPCAHTWADPPVGPTVADLVAGLSDQPGRAQGPAEDVVVDGYSGQRLVLIVPDIIPAACQGGRYVSWATPGGGLRWQQGPGQIQELLIVDADGERIVIDVSSFPDTSVEDLADMQSMVDSIRIEAR